MMPSQVVSLKKENKRLMMEVAVMVQDLKQVGTLLCSGHLCVCNVCLLPKGVVGGYGTRCEACVFATSL